MLYGISSGVAILCFSFALLWAYRRGVKDGVSINQGRQPDPIKTPVQMVRQHQRAKQTKVEQDRLMQGLQNILSYTGEVQKEEG